MEHNVVCIFTLLTLYSADKLVPFSPFSNRTIIDCLSFIERMDRLRFKDMMIVMARYQGQNKKGTPFVMNLKSFVPCHLILQTYVSFQREL